MLLKFNLIVFVGIYGSHVAFNFQCLPILEMGYFRIKAGDNILGIEEEIVWATPGQFTIMNYPCNEDGSDCGSTSTTQHYIDPASSLALIQRRLELHKQFFRYMLRTFLRRFCFLLILELTFKNFYSFILMLNQQFDIFIRYYIIFVDSILADDVRITFTVMHRLF